MTHIRNKWDRLAQQAEIRVLRTQGLPALLDMYRRGECALCNHLHDKKPCKQCPCRRPARPYKKKAE